MYFSTKWLVLWSLWAVRLIPHPTLTRRLRDGSLVRGTMSPDGSYQRYFSIPYASSQYKYRFQAPGPPPKWDGVFEAIEENVRCPQISSTSGGLIGTEDCLTLNVYSPSYALDGSPLPVMVFIHGGGFKEGSGTGLLYGPDYLVSHGIVLVTVNYRLNVHGFLCLGIKEAPGNAGLKDQVAALRWVQKNIKAFGGDPDNVTLFGESAGGASVSYHQLSPMSTGLFHRAILQSGSSIAPWARQRDPMEPAVSLAKALGHDIKDPYQLYKTFMNTSLTALVTTPLPKKKGRLEFAHLPYVPCTERLIDGVEPFLTDTPFNILSKGDYKKVPVIIGSNNEEGYFFAAFDTEETLRHVNFEAVLEVFDLDFPSDLERKEAATVLRKLYMGDDEISFDTIVKFSRLHGEPYFNLPAYIETELILKTSDKPVYNYEFQYNGWRNLPKFIAGRRFWNAPGASHADELFYLFDLLSAPLPPLFENKMIAAITTLWTNFAKFGTPTPQGSDVLWPATSLSSPTRLNLNETLSITSGLQNSSTLQYWRYLYDNYRALA